MLTEPGHANANFRRVDFRWEPLGQYLSRAEYGRDIGAVYAQSLLLTEWIVWHRGYRAMPAVAERYYETGSWDQTFRDLLGLEVAAVEPLVLSWAKAGRPAPPDGKQGTHRWTGTGWAPWRGGSDARHASRTLSLPLVPIRPANGRPVVGQLSSPGRSGGALKTRVVAGPLWDWMSGGTAPETVPGVSTPLTTAPPWQPPQVEIPPQTMPSSDYELQQAKEREQALQAQIAALQSQIASGAQTDPAVTGMLAALQQEQASLRAFVETLPDKAALNAATTDIQRTTLSTAEVVQAKATDAISSVKTWLGVGGSAVGAILALLMGGPTGLGLWGVKKVADEVRKDLKDYAESGGKNPTFAQQLAALTPWKWDDPLAKDLSDWLASRQQAVSGGLETLAARVAALIKGQQQGGGAST